MEEQKPPVHTSAAPIQEIPTKEEMRAALELRHTKAVQDKISDAHVAVCGLGGLGSNIAIALARCGVGHLHLIDFDTVDLTNLNRQQYGIAQLGQPKPAALKEELLQFAPYCEITTDYEKLTEENIGTVVTEPFVCEAFDAPEQKAILTNYVLEHMPQTWLVGASGMAGYESGNTIKTRHIMGRYYLCGDGTTGITEHYGLMAPRVMLCAAHQANMILRLILGETEI